MIKVGDLNKSETVSATIVESVKESNPEDPYDSEEERAEGSMFIGRLVAKLTKDPDGFCSTYREWHIFCRGFASGFRTQLTDKFTDCPEMWEEEIHYYQGGQELGYVARNAFIFICAGSAGTTIALNSSSIMAFLSNIL